MQSPEVTGVFMILLIALFGGFAVRLVKFPPLIGFIIAGVVGGAFLSSKVAGIDNLIEIGTVLLMFSIGIEMSFGNLKKVFKVGLLGTGLQIFAVSALSFLALTFFGVEGKTAFILSIGFSLSSTAIVVKILSDNGELDTLHGEMMIGWSLIQDLAVIPIMVILPVLNKSFGPEILTSAGKYLLQAVIVMVIIIVLGRLLVPKILHKIASVNSRELLILSSVALALGTAVITSLFGISPALGAFLAGVVISESQEHHAIFAETRPLRDLFVALFFVSLGFLVNPVIIMHNLPIVLTLAAGVILIKFIVVMFASMSVGYRGKTVIAAALGLSQIGEFAFVLFSQGKALGIMSEDATSIGIATALITLLVTPFLFKGINPTWKKFKQLFGKYPWYGKLISGYEKKGSVLAEELKNHIIICGYGRVGAWVGKALESAKVPFIVIDFRQEIVSKLRSSGYNAIYGDCGDLDVLKVAGLESAKAVIVAIPDHVVQEEIIAFIQNYAPEVKIIARAHLNEDFDKLRMFKVNQVVQPEFEAAVAIIRNVFTSMGKSKEDIAERLKNLRVSRAMS